MKNDFNLQIEELEEYIKNTNISTEARHIKKWAGADVVIKKILDSNTERWLIDHPEVISFQKTDPRRRAVITENYKELSWLFYQLRDLCPEKIDYVSKYDFYGLLAQSAIDYLSNNEREQNSKELLLNVLNAAKGFCDDEPSK